jgi:hypothetical protein
MRFRKGDSSRTRRYLATVYCDGHGLDLSSLRRYAEDGRPCSVSDSVAAIEAGECPACRPAYMSDEAPAFEVTPGAVGCGCCGTRWVVEGSGWAAVVDNGLAVVAEIEPIPVGASIDSSSFRVLPVDPVGGPTDVLRNELTAFAAGGGAGDLQEDALEDLVEGLSLAYGGRAREDAEIYRVLGESGLDDESADRWRREALVMLHDIRKLFGGIG